MISLWCGVFFLCCAPGVYIAYGLHGHARRVFVWVWCVVMVLAVAAYAYKGAAKGLEQAVVLSHQVDSMQQLWAKDKGASVVARMQAYVKQHPNDANAWYWLARLQWRRAHFVEAREALNHARRLAPSNPQFKALQDRLSND